MKRLYHPLRIVALVAGSLLVSSCSSAPPPPPKCEGIFRPVNLNQMNATLTPAESRALCAGALNV